MRGGGNEQERKVTMDSGNTAWMLTSAALVFLMTPGVAFFYGGMVRAKAVLNMLMLSAAALSVTAVVWTAAASAAFSVTLRPGSC